MTPLEVLDLPMDPDDNEAGASSIRGYLVAILGGAWGDLFDGKYGIEGSIDWRHRLYRPLVAAGAIPSPYDEDDAYMRSDDAARDACRQGDALIAAAISAMAAPVTWGDLLAAAVAAEEEAKVLSRRVDRLRQDADGYRRHAEAAR